MLPGRGAGEPNGLLPGRGPGLGAGRGAGVGAGPAAGFGAGAGAGVCTAGAGAGVGAAGVAGAGAGLAAAAFFAGAGAGAADFMASLILRTTGASIVDDADLTNSPMSWSWVMSSLLSTPISRASS